MDVKYAVDRVQGEIAVCEMPDGGFADIPLEKIGFPVKDGDTIIFDAASGVFRPDTDAGEQSRENKKRLEALFGKKKG